MAAKETSLNELGEMLAHVVEHMATKEDIIALRTDIADLGERVVSIEQELKQIRRDLNDLADAVENISGYRKEIDHALERIGAIERHLGIDRKTAA